MKLNALDNLEVLSKEYKTLKGALGCLKDSDAYGCVSINTNFGHIGIYNLPKSFNEIAVDWMEKRIEELENEIDKL